MNSTKCDFVFFLFFRLNFVLSFLGLWFWWSVHCICHMCARTSSILLISYLNSTLLIVSLLMQTTNTFYANLVHDRMMGISCFFSFANCNLECQIKVILFLANIGHAPFCDNLCTSSEKRVSKMTMSTVKVIACRQLKFKCPMAWSMAPISNSHACDCSANACIHSN